MKRFLRRVLSIVAVLALSAGPLSAHEPAPTGSQLLHQAMQRMHADMAAMKMSGDLDRDFASMMIIHHQGAIRMAQVELAHGHDPRLRRMATDIVRNQGKEIQALRGQIAAHGGGRSPGPATALEQAMQRMWRDMKAMKTSGNTDHDFAMMMIPHHQGAIDMARVEVSSGHHATLQRMAGKMIADQTAEIAELRAWLSAMGD